MARSSEIFRYSGLQVRIDKWTRSLMFFYSILLLVAFFKQQGNIQRHESIWLNIKALVWSDLIWFDRKEFFSFMCVIGISEGNKFGIVNLATEIMVFISKISGLMTMVNEIFQQQFFLISTGPMAVTYCWIHIWCVKSLGYDCMANSTTNCVKMKHFCCVKSPVESAWGSKSVNINLSIIVGIARQSHEVWEKFCWKVSE